MLTIRGQFYLMQMFKRKPKQKPTTCYPIRILFFYSRSKLKFAQGVPSDTIAFVNAFKVMCFMSSQEWFGYCFVLICVHIFLKANCLLLLGMAHSQNQRTYEKPKGE